MLQYENSANRINSLKELNDQNIKELPHNSEAEEILLGALMSENSSLERIDNGLRDFHFFVPILGRIYKAIFELIAKDQIANALTLEHYFADDSAFLENGGKNFLNRLCEGSLGSNIVKDYANLIILKVPKNFNIKKFIVEVNYKFLHIHKLNKMDIIVIENFGSS